MNKGQYKEEKDGWEERVTAKVRNEERRVHRKKGWNEERLEYKAKERKKARNIVRISKSKELHFLYISMEK